MSQTNPFAAVGRLLLALIFILSGLGKLGAPQATQGYIASVGIPLPMLSYLITIVVEVIGGLLLLVGYQTRIASLALGAFTLAAAVLFHSNFTDQNQMIHFLKNISIIGGLLHVAAFGAGALSIDARRLRTA